MLIAPTKKALPLFDALSIIPDIQEVKVIGKTNPYYSWHASYMTLDYKKVVVLINDLTLVPVILFNINAKNKKLLPNYIADGIRQAFILSGVSSRQIDNYFEQAGLLECGQSFDRKVLASLNNITVSLNRFSMDKNAVVQTSLMRFYAKIPLKKLDYQTPEEYLNKIVQTSIPYYKITSEMLTEKEIDLTKYVTWKDYSDWQEVIENQDNEKASKKMSYANYDKYCNEIRANNELMLRSFRLYLKEVQGLSQKVIDKHCSNLDFFVNQYLLYYGIETVISNIYGCQGFLGGWFGSKVIWATVSTIKSNGASIKKLYTFLNDVGAITTDDLAEVKLAIRDSVELGIEELEDFDDDPF
ncbi:MAG: DUF6933 domain-containing protein [Bavariicoccus seileri]|uniref:DUF6933 domain-containing protein n=1 Tax=Bavariicoccus seileri TaxID=549685 RepID=UPI003F9B9A4C